VCRGPAVLISPKGEYDVELNRYFSVWLASSLRNTQAAHAHDLRWFSFANAPLARLPMTERADLRRSADGYVCWTAPAKSDLETALTTWFGTPA
jgi:hypothetical protein